MANKIPIYALVSDGHFGEMKVLLGLATVMNGQYIFDKEDLHPAILAHNGEVVMNALISHEGTITDMEEWKRTRRQWEDNDDNPPPGGWKRYQR